jgi:signal transduction histidine kinase
MDRILVVDDDPVILKLYQIILKKEGFEMDIATCGDECLVALNKQKPDVILLDVILPDCSGLQLCNQIKSNPEFLGIKIILVSGMEISPSQIAQGIETGADDYLVKPFDHKELLARVRNCLKLKKIEEALRDKNTELKDLSWHLQNVREEERKFFAREVQEELGQITAVLKMDIDWLAINMSDAPESHRNRMAHASDMAKLIINTIRRIASSLRPSMIDELGLHASLDWKCKQFTTNHGIPCVFEHTGEDENLSIEIKTGLFRICQEILNNVSGHALATKVSVITNIEGKKLILVIKDNGKGFDVNQQKSSLGLISIRERAASLKGEMSFISEIGKGTSFTVKVPIS